MRRHPKRWKVYRLPEPTPPPVSPRIGMSEGIPEQVSCDTQQNRCDDERKPCRPAKPKFSKVRGKSRSKCGWQQCDGGPLHKPMKDPHHQQGQRNSEDEGAQDRVRESPIGREAKK